MGVNLLAIFVAALVCYVLRDREKSFLKNSIIDMSGLPRTFDILKMNKVKIYIRNHHK